VTLANDDILDVLILGAGFSGLSAARELDELGARFRVLDAYSDHLGGRAYSYRLNDDLGFDHGAEYLGDLQNGIMKLARTLLPEGEIVNGASLRVDAPEEVMFLADHRFCFDKADAALGIQGIPPDIGVISLLGIIGALAEMTLIELFIDVAEPWRSPAWAVALDQVTVEAWMAERPWLDARARALMRISVEALLSVEPAQISPFYLLWYTACNDGLLNEVNDDAGGPQQYWLKKGMSHLAERFAEPIRDRIDQGVRVVRVDHGGDVVRVEAQDGAVYRARRLLLATSPHSTGRIQFTPEPPPDRRALFDLPMGKTVKCQVFYSSRWWYDSHGLKYDGYVGGADFPVCWVMDNTPPDGAASGPFVLMTFTVGAQVDKLGAAPTDAHIQQVVLDALVFLFHDERARQIDRIVIHRWVPADPFVGGGPNTVFTPGVLTGAPGRLLDQPWGDKLFFASSENARNLHPRSTSPTWSLLAGENLPAYGPDCVLLPTSKPPFTSRYSDMRRSLGYMDGALESGRFGAHQVARSLGLAGHALVDAPAAASRLEPAAPAEATPLTPADAATLLAAVLDELHPATPVRAGLVSATSRLREAILRGLTRTGKLSTSADHPAALTALRDFAVSVIGHASADQAAASEEARPHLEGVRSAVDAVESRLRSLLRR